MLDLFYFDNVGSLYFDNVESLLPGHHWVSFTLIMLGLFTLIMLVLIYLDIIESFLL